MEERSKEQPTGSHSEVEQRAQAATEAAKREAHQLTEEAKHKLDSEVSTRKGMIAKELGHLGKALESSAQELEKHDSVLTDSLRQVARFCGRSAQSMERKGPRELLAQAEDFGRQQPLAFFGAAVAASFLATRLLRSDSGQIERTSAEEEPLRSGGEWEQTAFERQEGEATTQVLSPSIPASETIDLTGPMSEGDRPYGTT